MRKRKQIEIILMMLLLVPAALASVPNNQVTQLFEDEVPNGITDVGDLLIIPLQYTAEVYNLTNFSTTMTPERFDRFTWLGTESIAITDPLNRETVLVPGAQFYFSQTGTHTFVSLINSSNTGIIFVSSEPQNVVNIQLDEVPNGFDLNFSENNFILGSEERVVEATLIVDDDIEPGEYMINYTADGVTKEYEFTVIRNTDWNITDVSFDKEQSIKSGDDAYLGTIEIENLGNQDVEITLEKAGNQSQIVVVPSPKTLFKKSTIEFDIQLNVPSVTPKGTYDIVIRATDVFGKVQNVSLEVTVSDALKPRIESINFSTDKAFMENEIVVIATDNEDVKNVTLEYDGKKIFLEKDQNRFTTTQVFNKISQYNMVFCAFDAAENTECELVNRTFIKIAALDGVEKRIRMPTVKFAKYSSAFLVNLTESIEEGISVELVSMESDVRDDENAYTIRLVDEEGGIKRFDAYDNEIIIKDKGIYTLEVRSQEMRDYEGLIRFNVPEYVEEVSDVAFTVSFKGFDIPKDFSVDWFGENVTCKVVDTGDLDTSYRECPIRIDIDTDENDIALPTTIREREQLDSQVDEVEEELSDVKRRNATIITLLVFFAFIMIFTIYYIVNVYPYTRSMRKVKSND